MIDVMKMRQGQLLFTSVVSTYLLCLLSSAVSQRVLTHRNQHAALSHFISQFHHGQDMNNYMDNNIGNLEAVKIINEIWWLTIESAQERVLEWSMGVSHLGEEMVRYFDQTLQMNVSQQCLNNTIATFDALLRGENWAIQMLDAMGKPSSGIMNGNLNWPGAFKLCLDVQATDATHPEKVTTDHLLFSGQYCSVTLPLVNSSEGHKSVLLTPELRVGVCVPDSCSAMDIQLMLNSALGKLNITQKASVSLHPRNRLIDTKAIVAIVICSIFLLLMVVGTAIDIIYIHFPTLKLTSFQYSTAADDTVVNERHPLLHVTAQEISVPETGLCTRLITSFSIYSNGAKLLSTQKTADSLTCIHGIRFLSMTWVVLSHAYEVPALASANFVPFIQKSIKKWSFQVIGNGVLSVDTFFTLSGLLVAYLSLKELKKNNGKLSWFLFYFHRFWRLTPVYMLVMMVYLCLSPYWGHGPLWEEDQPDRDNCEVSWWTNLLYINNLVYIDKVCLGQSWYLANDMQFYILSPLIFMPLYFCPRWGAVSSLLFLLVTSLTPAILTVHNNYPPSIFVQLDINNTDTSGFANDFYIRPYNRMGPYIIGMLAGYFLYRTNCKLSIGKVTNLCAWALATAAALGVVYGLYNAFDGQPVTLAVSAFYNAINRQVWAACVCWVIIACITGNGGFINMLLSWSALVPLSRLTYCVYLVHLLVMTVCLFNGGTVFYINDINLIMFFFSVLVLSYLVAFVTSLAFEAPMLALEKILIHGKKPSKDPP